MKLTPVVRLLNQNRKYRKMFKSDDIDAMLSDAEVSPCIVRMATPAERIKYGIRGGAGA